MSARPKGKGPTYKGHDSHVHVTVTAKQRAKLLAQAKRAGVSISVQVRGMIDDMEVSK